MLFFFFLSLYFVSLILVIHVSPTRNVIQLALSLIFGIQIY